MTPTDITAALAAPFDATEVKFKPQTVKGNRALALAYVDARVIEDRLDAVLGVEGWQDDYETLTDGSVVCRLKLLINGNWVCKMDVGSPSEQPDPHDRVKAAFSDALKRAAVKFGIGRYLYRLPAQWADYDPAKKQFSQPPRIATMSAKALRVPVQAAEPVKSAQPLPADGTELHRRLREYDTKLSKQNLCGVGALLAHVTETGVKAGFPPEITAWNGPAIPFAVAAVKEFEAGLRGKSADPRSAA